MRETVARLQGAGIRVSLFMGTDLPGLELAKATGAARIELYTEPYARACEEGRGEESWAKFDAAARRAGELGLGVNAGHDLSLENLGRFLEIPDVLEVSIGHALICDALDTGLETAVRNYLNCLKT